jgi:hypothetical protein
LLCWIKLQILDTTQDSNGEWTHFLHQRFVLWAELGLKVGLNIWESGVDRQSLEAFWLFDRVENQWFRFHSKSLWVKLFHLISVFPFPSNAILNIRHDVMVGDFCGSASISKIQIRGMITLMTQTLREWSCPASEATWPSSVKISNSMLRWQK